MTTTTLNSKPRRSLAEQIDRMDSILDGLADGLNEAVTTVVQQTVAMAVKEAVQAVMVEMLTNPELLRKLQGNFAAAQPKTTEPAKPTLKQRLSNLWKKVIGGCKWVGSMCKAGVLNAATGTVSLVRKTGSAVVSAIASYSFLGRFKKQILLAVAIGTVVALSTWYADPWLSTAAGWIGGFATTLSVQFVLWFRRMMNTFGDLSIGHPAYACGAAPAMGE
jgi:hypothetical protein